MSLESNFCTYFQNDFLLKKFRIPLAKLLNVHSIPYIYDMGGNFKHLHQIDGKIDNWILFHTFQHTIIFLLHPSIDGESFRLNCSLVRKLQDIKGTGYCSYVIQSSL